MSFHKLNVLKFRTLFSLFSNKTLIFMAGIHKFLVKTASREDPDQTLQKQFDLGLSCLLRPFWQGTSVRNFRIFPYFVYGSNEGAVSDCTFVLTESLLLAFIGPVKPKINA